MAVFETVGLIVKPHLTNITPYLTELTERLTARGCRVVGEAAAAHLLPPSVAVLSATELAAQADLVIVIGGDGTMIYAARLLGERDVPVLGVNYGYLGYLTEYTPETAYAALERVFAGDLRVDVRMKLEATVERGGEPLLTAQAVNDCVITKSMLARLIPIECWIGGQFVSTFHADGLIIATPTGSTAYSLSAGGPIVHPAMQAIVITPICPHTLTNRPLVVPDTSEIELRLSTERGPFNVEDVFLTFDGQTGCAVEPEDRVLIRKSASVLKLIEPADKDYFQLLRDKLKWGNT
ncbi:MAG: NAD(+)/NADH kinase [Chloracidobacterium sp.]|nr:NAD(+)/NADH kinase [Chloracidobacterium sp.]MDW8218335.1 NAD(+)/NADH kinase [Acidobacteriota bacterium]